MTIRWTIVAWFLLLGLGASEPVPRLTVGPCVTRCLSSSIVAPARADALHRPADVAARHNWLAPSDKSAAPTCTATNYTEFTSCIRSLRPGAIVQVDDQAWRDKRVIAIRGNGSAAAPITIRAQHSGGVTLTGLNVVTLVGSWLRLEGFSFRGPYAGSSANLEIGTDAANSCDHCLVDSVRMLDRVRTDGQSVEFVVHGSWNRISHVSDEGKTNQGEIVAVVNLGTDPPDHTLVDHSYFANMSGADSAFQWGVGYDSSCHPTCPPFRDSAGVVRDNLFYRVAGRIELLAFKAGGVVVRGNTFQESGPSNSNRTSDDNIYEANVFLGDDVPRKGGILIHGDGHTVVHNIFQSINPGGQVYAYPISIYSGSHHWATDKYEYKPVTSAYIAFNIFADNKVDVVAGDPATLCPDCGVQPTGVRLQDNAFGIASGDKVLSRSAGSTMQLAHNACDGSLDDAACDNAVTLAKRADGLYMPTDPANRALIASRTAYASLGLPEKTLRRLYYLNLYPGRPIAYKVLTRNDVGPLKW